MFEVNTAVWLGEVSRRVGHRVTLGEVPRGEWDALVRPGVNVVWLMGVWQRSEAGRAIALLDDGLRRSWSTSLPGWADSDVVGSPYCIRDYVPDALVGTWADLKHARGQLRARGARLMLDWVPNHMAPDSPWLEREPAAFIHGTPADLTADDKAYVAVGTGVFARGKDPYFAPWPDVVQVNAFAPQLRELAARTLTRIAEHADAVRCDMAMLMLDDVVRATWGDRAGQPLPTQYWTDVIARVHERNPDFRFVAEAYWDREWDLQQLGFAYCYDKRLYDRMRGGDPGAVRGHLGAPLDYQARLVRFLENHDEPRAATTFLPAGYERVAAVAIATLPGMTLWHQGQAEGRQVFCPVFLGRRPDEVPDADLAAFHHQLWALAARVRVGQWSLRPVHGWPDNPSADRLAAWTWTDGDRLSLVVVNLSEARADGMVDVGHGAAAGRRVRLTDLLDGTTYERDGDDLAGGGLYVARDGWGAHVLTLDASG